MRPRYAEGRVLSLAGVRSPRPWQVEMWLALGVDADLADVDDPDEGETPLLRAAANNRAAVMELLLQHGADAMHTNSEGKTALMTAASFGHVRAMRILFLYPPYSATVPTSEMVAVDSSPRKPEDAQDRLGDASSGCDGGASFAVCISDADNARSYRTVTLICTFMNNFRKDRAGVGGIHGQGRRGTGTAGSGRRHGTVRPQW